MVVHFHVHNDNPHEGHIICEGLTQGQHVAVHILKPTSRSKNIYTFNDTV